MGLIVVAVAATIVGAAVAMNTPPPADAGFGSALDRAVLPGADPHLRTEIAGLRHRFGRVEVIENQTLTIPGSIYTYQLIAENPAGPFGGPMLLLLSGHYPTGPDQVAVTDGLATSLGLRLGAVWRQGDRARRVVGLVANPQNLLEDFALVAPGQVTAPTQVTLLFNAPGVSPAVIGSNVATPESVAQQNALNPETISIAGLTLGMLLIALVAVGGFTVLAQRRLRALGVLETLGATARHVRLVLRTNGVVTGMVGAALGVALGFAAWLGYRPRLQRSVHHLIGLFALPWLVVALAVVLALVATYIAAARPARSITRIPVVAALSGRPPVPMQVHRTATPGIAFLVAGFLLLGYAGSGRQGHLPELVLGLVALVPGVILLAPFCLSVLARLGQRSPIAIRLALRDLARYRARSGSALAAVSISILIAVIIVILAAVRYGNALDYAGPNLASNQLIIYSPTGPGYLPPGMASPLTTGQLSTISARAQAIAATLGAGQIVELDSTSATLNYNGVERNWNGVIYVATPELLAAFGIRPNQVDPAADILTMRPGIATLSRLQLVYGGGGGKGQPRAAPAGCTTAAGCLPNPTMQQINHLPSGTSEYGAHRIRRSSARAADATLGLAHPDAPGAHGCPGCQRPAGRGRCRSEHRGQE